MTTPTQAVVPSQTRAVAPRKAAAELLELNKQAIRTALGNAVPVEFFNRVALTSISKSPLLAACTPESLMMSLLDCAQIRLVPDGVTGEAYLVPFWNKNLGAHEAKLMIGYKGYVKLVRRNAEVKNISAEVVYKNEKFICRYGTHRELTHEPMVNGEDKGDPIGAYAFIEYANGGSDFRFTDAPYINRVMQSSKGWDKPDSPWQNWWESMWCKTAIKQLVKTADISPETREAINKDLDTGSIDISATVQAAQEKASVSVLAKTAAAELPPSQAAAPGQPETAPPAGDGDQGPQETQPAGSPAGGGEAPPQTTAVRRGRPPKALQQTAVPPQQQAPANVTQMPQTAPKIGAVPPAPPRSPAAGGPKMTGQDLAEQNRRILEEMQRKKAQTQPQPAAPEPAPEPQDDLPPDEGQPEQPDASTQAQADDQNLFPE